MRTSCVFYYPATLFTLFTGYLHITYTLFTTSKRQNPRYKIDRSPAGSASSSDTHYQSKPMKPLKPHRDLNRLNDNGIGNILSKADQLASITTIIMMMMMMMMMIVIVMLLHFCVFRRRQQAEPAGH